MLKKIFTSIILSTAMLGLISCRSDTQAESKNIPEININNPGYDYVYQQGMNKINEAFEKIDAENAAKEEEFKNNTVTVPNGFEAELPRCGTVKLKSYSIVHEGTINVEDAIYLTFEYTNTTDKDSGFYSFSNFMNVYQDGVELYSYNGDFCKEFNTTIRPGYSIEVTVMYNIRNRTSPIAFCFEDLMHETKSEHTLEIN